MTFVAGVEGLILGRGNFFFIALIESAVKECFINCEQRAAIGKKVVAEAISGTPLAMLHH